MYMCVTYIPIHTYIKVENERARARKRGREIEREGERDRKRGREIEREGERAKKRARER